MQTIALTLPQRSRNYTITIGTNLLSNITDVVDLSGYSKILVVTDRNVARHWLKPLLRALPSDAHSLILPAGEKHKNLQTVDKIWKKLHDINCDRKSLVITLSGGVVGDMAAFAASTYMRGIAFIHIPTSLLAQVDSSIGGKTGIDHCGIKNLIGTFEQPKAVIIDTSTLSTLPRRELVSAFGEIVKHGLIQDPVYFQKVTQKHATEWTAEELVEIIATSCQIKADLVQSDQYESGQRKALNLGHTVGHAIEALSWDTGSPLLHGEAVSIGTVIEAELSVLRGLAATDARTIQSALCRVGLPIQSPQYSIDSITQKMHSDKKNVSGSIRLTLLSAIGSVVWDQEVPESDIQLAIKHHMEA